MVTFITINLSIQSLYIWGGIIMITPNVSNKNINHMKTNLKNAPLPHQKPNTDIQNPINSKINTYVSKNKHIELGGIFNIKASLNNIAKHLRTTNNSINKTQGWVEKIKNNLKTIRKNFPPFPPGSEERIQILKNITAFQKQINELTFPPPKLNEWDILRMDTKSLPRLDLHEINSTYLDENATDEHIASSTKQFDAIDEKLRQKKSGLKSYMENTINSALNIFLKTNKDMINTGISSNQANAISLETKSLLLSESKMNLINDHALLEI